MPIDPLFQAIFDTMPQFANPPFWRMSPDEARDEFRRMSQLANPAAPAIGRTEHLEALGPDGPIPMRLYVPVAAGGDALPVILFFHGGGFVMGDLDSHDALCRSLANESGCALISVDYRLAPEHKFPAAVEDCFAALSWVEANGPTLGVDPNRIAVAGDSAGANLAAVCCLMAREKGRPRVAFQLLIYPPTSFAQYSPSLQAIGAGFVLNDPILEWCISHYVPKDADRSDYRLSPALATELKGLPPAYLVTAGFDPLHDEGSSYAEQLKQAGVAVAHVNYPSMIHGFFNMQGLVPLASEAIAAAAHAVRDALK
jgi:acetyl esterase